jgi:hypothetical protein
MDGWKRLFNEPGTLFAIFSSGMIGLGVGIANGVVQRKHGGWSGFFGAITVGVAVAVIVGLGVEDYIKSETLRLAIVGVCAVISDDIWNGLKTFGAGLRTDPLGSISRFIDALRGRATLGSSAPAVPSRPASTRFPDDDDPRPMRPYKEE